MILKIMIKKIKSNKKNCIKIKWIFIKKLIKDLKKNLKDYQLGLKLKLKWQKKKKKNKIKKRKKNND